MIYDSLDTIPAKLYERIEATGDIRLLTDDPTITDDVLSSLWDALVDEDAKITSQKDVGKVLDVSKKIESLAARLKFVEISIKVLSKIKKDELIEKLESVGYRFKFKDLDGSRKRERQYLRDIEKIERQSGTLSIKIGRLKEKLPKKSNSNSNEKVTFDETILGYGVVCGMGFIDTNKITRTQYHALIKTGNKKMKSLASPSDNAKKSSRYGKR